MRERDARAPIAKVPVSHGMGTRLLGAPGCYLSNTLLSATKAFMPSSDRG